MLITRQSPWSGKVHTLDLPITDDQREFFMTGITGEEWEEAWGSRDNA